MSTSTLSRVAGRVSTPHLEYARGPLLDEYARGPLLDEYARGPLLDEYARGPLLDHLTIRLANPDDLPALRRLAALDSAPVPRGRTLLAEIDGQLRAALALNDGRIVADPFVRTLELVELLRKRGRWPTGEPRTGRPRRRRIARRSTGLSHS
jgi:IS5 family transposase